jgi:hypothetical protein
MGGASRSDVEIEYGPQFDTIGGHSYAHFRSETLKPPGVAASVKGDISGVFPTFSPRLPSCRPFITFALALLVLASGGCVDIEGGAVEVSWVVRSTSGSAITNCGCADPPIDKVRLVLVPRGASIEGNNPCEGAAQCEFPCQRQTGSTAFNIKPTQAGESYEISVVAVGADGNVLEGVMTPAPILRSVVSGQPTEVEAFQLVAPCRAECEMNGSGVCARP